MKLQINKSHIGISMKHSFYAQEAVLFWHERIGRYLGSFGPMESIMGKYLKRTSKGEISGSRIGADGPPGIKVSAILIDALGANLVDKLDGPSIAGFDKSPVNLVRNSSDFSLLRGMMDWMLDTRRVFPMLIAMPTKADVTSSLRLSKVDEEVCICSPGSTMVFNARKVRAARDYLLEKNIPGTKWRKACDLRLLVSSGDYSKNPLTANKTLDAYAKSLETLPLSVWLPIRNTPDFEALSNAMISTKQGLQIDPIA